MTENANTADADIWGVTIQPHEPIINVQVVKILAGTTEELMNKVREARSNMFEAGLYIMEEHYSSNVQPPMLHLPGCTCSDKEEKTDGEPVWATIKYTTRQERAMYIAHEVNTYFQAFTQDFSREDALELTKEVLRRIWGN